MAKQGQDRRAAEAIDQLLRGHEWREIAASLGVSVPTAKARLAKTFACLALTFAERGDDDTFLEALKQRHNLLAVNVLRLWVKEKKPKDMVAELNISCAEVRRILAQVIAFCVNRLR